MKRREFFNWVGLGLLASSLPVALAAFTSEDTTFAATTSKTTKKWQKVGTVTELDKTGQLLVENSPIGALLVVGTSKKPKNLIAVKPNCTHQGCTVEWNTKNSEFACPCHGAKFASNGKVQNGPANKPLKTYQVKIEAGAVFVLSV
ncbi:ubiquinol-cytochrome c reductase iron-sulfur subunit [Anabaena sp. FACHB-1237]|uniref:QcrA and Rieske domain-containing protein n=1 Tax=Anabaena sp. FACHB-1237 TaxID=2692769 RepID=UPI001680CEB8|nr:ubiquinol-cytochrome c reductase iron-sulfur subunit [Anabaena sp. FACHB-1237]MBD2139779.1 ubiquinol-cytochrome c reductase iron-sulfur subunit [Anabaena sp. FACHB-1237]